MWPNMHGTQLFRLVSKGTLHQFAGSVRIRTIPRCLRAVTERKLSMKMFEQTFVATGKTHKTTTVLVSFVVQTILVIIGILIPMIYFDALPTAQLQSLLVAPPPPPPRLCRPRPNLPRSSRLFRVSSTPVGSWRPGKFPGISP